MSSSSPSDIDWSSEPRGATDSKPWRAASSITWRWSPSMPMAPGVRSMVMARSGAAPPATVGRTAAAATVAAMNSRRVASGMGFLLASCWGRGDEAVSLP